MTETIANTNEKKLVAELIEAKVALAKVEMIKNGNLVWAARVEQNLGRKLTPRELDEMQW